MGFIIFKGLAIGTLLILAFVGLISIIIVTQCKGRSSLD